MTLVAGCNEKLDIEDFTYTVEINSYIYGLDGEEIPADNIGRAFEGHNGISCKYPECPAPDGTDFYEIKNTPVNKAIARKVFITEDEAIYRKCVMIKKVEKN